MLKPDEKLNISLLFEAGLSLAEIARRTNRSIGTIQKYKTIQKYQSNNELPTISEKIAPVKSVIDSKIKTGRVNATKLFKQLKATGYCGSYATLSNYISTYKARIGSNKPSQSVIHSPGQQAQMDWGSFGKIILNGKEKKLYAFLYVLSYSRALYVEFVVKQDRFTLESCHKRAFEELGIPQSIRYDNMKSVVAKVERVAGEVKQHINPEFKNFADHYGFKIEPSYPYHPQSKGKVESAVKYLRNNFMIDQRFGKTYFSLDELNDLVKHWLDDEANTRIHTMTKQRPIDLWAKEKDFLRFPDNIPNYSRQPLLKRQSNQNALVAYGNNLYKVPLELGQKKLFVREVEHRGSPKLEIYKGDLLVCTHDIPEGIQGKIVEIPDQTITTSIKKYRKVRTKKGELLKRLAKIKVPERDLSYYDTLIRKDV